MSEVPDFGSSSTADRWDPRSPDPRRLRDSWNPSAPVAGGGAGRWWGSAVVVLGRGAGTPGCARLGPRLAAHLSPEPVQLHRGRGGEDGPCRGLYRDLGPVTVGVNTKARKPRARGRARRMGPSLLTSVLSPDPPFQAPLFGPRSPYLEWLRIRGGCRWTHRYQCPCGG